MLAETNAPGMPAPPFVSPYTDSVSASVAVGVVGQVDQREREVEETDPDEQVQHRDARGRYEQHPQREHHQRCASEDPRLAPPEACLPPIGQDADQRVRKHIRQARQGEYDTDERERELEVAYVEGGDLHRDRKADDRGRQVRDAIDRYHSTGDGRSHLLGLTVGLRDGCHRPGMLAEQVWPGVNRVARAILGPG